MFFTGADGFDFDEVLEERNRIMPNCDAELGGEEGGEIELSRNLSV